MLEAGKVKNTEQVVVIWTNGKNSTFYYVGASMLPLISKRQWSTSSAGYANATYFNKRVYLHELVYHGSYEAVIAGKENGFNSGMR